MEVTIPDHAGPDQGQRLERVGDDLIESGAKIYRVGCREMAAQAHDRVVVLK